jgi:hypothetical protein
MQAEGGAHRGGINGGRRSSLHARGKDGSAFITERVVGKAVHQRPLPVGSQYGRGRAATCERMATCEQTATCAWEVTQRRKAVRLSGKWEIAAWCRPRTCSQHAQRRPGTAHEPLDTGRPRRVRTAGTAARQRGVERRRAQGVLACFQIGLAPFDQDFLKFLQLKCSRQCIPKLFISLPSTTSRKALGCFSQPNLHALHAKLEIFRALVNSACCH